LKILSVFLILLIFAIPDVWAQVNIENDQYYVSNNGIMHIVGEVLNDSDKPLNQVNIFATLYSDDSVIHQINSETLTNVIMPGMKGVFDIIITENIDGVDRYVLDLDYKITNPKSQVIEITSSELRYAQFDNIIIKGTVANNGDITANMVKVIGTLYDKEGNVVAVSQIRMEPDYIRANDESFFLMSVPDRSQTDIMDYSLVAESEEYTAVPEFPLGSGVLLIASLSAYIVLTKNPSAVTRSISRLTNSTWILNRFN
jgi:hypothetical protein